MDSEKKRIVISHSKNNVKSPTVEVVYHTVVGKKKNGSAKLKSATKHESAR